MTSLSQSHHSFVIRIWWEETGIATGSRPVWRGWVQHTGSGQEAYVQSVEELLRFMERRAGPLTLRESASGMQIAER